MESVTKSKKSNETVTAIVKKAFPGLSATEITELKEGFFNAAYSIQLSDGRETILKIAPSRKVRIMTHEINIMDSEVKAMQLVADKTNVPVPAIYYYDNSHEACYEDYFFMQKLSGQSYSSRMNELDDEDKKRIDYQIGQFNAQINAIQGDRFGYFGQRDKQGHNWFDVFGSLLQDAIQDAASLDIDLPFDPNRLMEMLERDRGYFGEITIPKLVHWDLWSGNVFIEHGTVTGFIDFERCLWADELMEVGFRSFGINNNFLNGYGFRELSDDQKIRARWYDMYFYLISALECDYRKYADRGSYNWATQMIKEWMR